jgi:LmbE family N-acetylglucosaminyl deacetylase
MLDWLDRSVAIVAAHPDDETIGVGAQFINLRDPLLIHVTDGAPRSLGEAREAYARIRRGELAAALEAGGGASAILHEIGLVDQEASFHLVELAEQLAVLFRERRPEVVLTHPYEGGHPDHDATAFAVHTAIETMKREKFPVPVLLEFTSYHADKGRMLTGDFLPFEGCEELAFVLTAEARQRKQKMFDCFITQREVLRNFSVNYERFRVAPQYDFTELPPVGELFYEQFDWGMTGDRWKVLVKEAIGTLARITL